MRLAVLGLWAMVSSAQAFVFLDTSTPDSTTRKAVADTLPVSVPQPPAVPVPAAGPASSQWPSPRSAADSAQGAASRRDNPGGRSGPTRFRTVLFLSADSKLVYAYIGVLKALEQYGLAPDAVLAESKAVAVGAAWALGYSAAATEGWFLAHPLESLLSPFPAKKPVEDRTYIPDGRDPPQWDVPLSLQAFQSRSLKWTEVAAEDPGEYLHLSWAIARLTHDAPAGPVEDIQAAPRRLAVQVSDLESSQEAVVTEGSLQNVLKGSLLPAEVVRRRQRLWPYASGALLSGHAVMADKLPFACDRIILVEPGRRLRPPALQPSPLPWTDSLTLRAKALAAAQDAEAFPAGLQAKALRIELSPDPGFDPEESDPARWIALGYASTLRSMDVLKSALAASAPAPKGGEPASDGRLGLNRLSINPLAPGGHQLLLDILRLSEGEASDSDGEASISALTQSGFYSDLDVEWAKGDEQDKALLVFDAREKSRVRFRAGWNALIVGDDMAERPPQVYGGLIWSEPFYIPMEAEGGALLGGTRPGYQWRFMIAPIFPMRLELGLDYIYEQANFPIPAQASSEAFGALPFPIRYRRQRLQGFFNFYPSSRFWSKSRVESDSLTLFHDVDEPDTLKSVDFRETLYLGLGKAQAEGFHALSWKGDFRFVDPVNLSGSLRNQFSSVDSRLRLAWKDFRLVDQYYWSDQDSADADIRELYHSSAAYDLLEAGRIDAFSFQDDYFFRFLRSRGFQDVRLEYCPTWGRGGLRVTAGAWRNYGRTLLPEQAEKRDILGMSIPGRAHWEIQAGYATPVGSLRVGMGGLDGESPFYYVRLGSDLRLGFGEDD